MTPYHWQEAMGHRAEFVESRLLAGAPILALSVPEGIVIFTYRRASAKLFEVYDRLALAAVGQQSDIEALRVAAVDFAHREGYTRSEADVTIRLVVQAVSAPLKSSFADFNLAPFVIRALFAEIGANPAADTYAIVNYDGDFRTRRSWAYAAVDSEHDQVLHAGLSDLFGQGLTPEQACTELQRLWDAAFIVERPEGFVPEAVLLKREDSPQRFQWLTDTSDL